MHRDTSVVPAHYKLSIHVRLIFVCEISQINYLWSLFHLHEMLTSWKVKKPQTLFSYLNIKKSININRVSQEIFLHSFFFFFKFEDFLGLLGFRIQVDLSIRQLSAQDPQKTTKIIYFKIRRKYKIQVNSVSIYHINIYIYIPIQS